MNSEVLLNKNVKLDEICQIDFHLKKSANYNTQEKNISDDVTCLGNPSFLENGRIYFHSLNCSVFFLWNHRGQKLLISRLWFSTFFICLNSCFTDMFYGPLKG